MFMHAITPETGILASFKNRLQRELFLPTLLSIAISPIYIIRKGLYRQVQRLAPEFKGDVLDFGCGSKPSS